MMFYEQNECTKYPIVFTSKHKRKIICSKLYKNNKRFVQMKSNRNHRKAHYAEVEKKESILLYGIKVQ